MAATAAAAVPTVAPPPWVPRSRPSAWRAAEAPRPRAVAVAAASSAAAAASSSSGLNAAAVAPSAARRGGGVREYVEAAREMARWRDGGPPRWFSPLECAGGDRIPGAPTMLYLPGIDGVGLGLTLHHERLAKIFGLWCMHIPVEDRTSFEGNSETSPGLVDYVERTVKSESSRAPDRPVYLVGESLGACIALAVAAQNPDIDLVLVLVNPGTSFHKSQLQSLSAFLELVPEPFHLTTPQLLNFLTGNFMKMASAFVGQGLSLEEAGQTISELTTITLDSLTFLVDTLTKESIIWKLKMLRTASSFVNSRLHAVKAQTLVLASGNDELFPSREEGERLLGALEKCRTHHFRDNGHKILLEAEFDLTITIKGAGYYRRSRKMDFVSDYLTPTLDELQKAIDHERALVEFHTGPVKLPCSSKTGNSTEDPAFCHQHSDAIDTAKWEDSEGARRAAKEGPASIVGYHMLLGIELGPLVTGVLSSTGIYIRGLAHPYIFYKNTEQLMLDPAHFDLHRVMGAVPVTGTNFYKLLLEKQFVLLYPGGAREALHRKGEEYKLFWPEQSEFVRMASRFGAKIIPIGVVGEDDICDLLLDYNDLLKLPFYDVLDKMLNEEDVKLRTDSTGDLKNQGIHPVVVTPKVPGRFYFVFGKPIETRGREKELKDKDKAQRLYLEVKSEVENCINYLKEKREVGPYRSIVPRLLYQAVHGPNAEVPTFEP
ncbi:hypothetical protein ACP4OV_024239 [Aristida adscensionis]